jgi:maleate isomerase
MIAQVSQQDIRNALLELDGPDVEALLAVGTALPSGAAAAEAERWFNKPVIAVNTVSFWDALRRCGIADHVQGHGRVLEEL